MKPASCILYLVTCLLSPAAVVHRDGLQVTGGVPYEYNTRTGPFGSVPIDITSDIEGPEYQLLVGANSLTLTYDFTHNKNSAVMAYVGTAALLAEGKEVLMGGLWPHSAAFDLWWREGVAGYLGLILDPTNLGEPEDKHYGWLYFMWGIDGSIKIGPAGYESVPDKMIYAGVVPEVGTNFIIAFALCLLLLRRHRVPTLHKTSHESNLRTLRK